MASNRPLGLLGPAKVLSKHAKWGGRHYAPGKRKERPGKPRPSWTKSSRRNRGSLAGPRHLQVARLSPDAFLASDWRLRERGWLWGRDELRKRRAQRIKPRGMGKSVVFDGAPDYRSYRGEFLVGEANCRHGSDSIGRHLSSKEAIATPGGP
jgi:hypothetical protein